MIDENYSSSDDNEYMEYEGKTEDNMKNGKLYHMNTFTKFDQKISLHQINNKIEACEKKDFTKEKKNKDKSQRATVEQVLDPRTRLILLKMMAKQVFTTVNGCLSTGK